MNLANMSVNDTNNKVLQDHLKTTNKNMDNKQLRSVCNDFESFFMKQILDVSLKSSTIAGEGTGSEIFKSMYTQSLSQQSSGTLGISDMLFKFLSEKNNDK